MRAKRPRWHARTRPELARLAFIVGESDRARCEAMFREMRDSAWNSAADAALWIDAARTLHDRDIITDDVLIFLTTLFLETVTQDACETDAELLKLQDEMEKVERKHGLTEDEYFLLDDAPAEYTRLSRQWDVRADAISAAFLEEMGWTDLADIFVARDEWEERSSAGRAEFWSAMS